ncbi:MAG: hypothetical protein ABSG50_06215 [Opitutaceae bacterium]|jgi:hypothetical protein
MATQEYYVRGINDTEARGPFTVEQLLTLGETGQIDNETLFYDAATEQWSTIGSNEELKNAVFPQKKKLTFKPKESIEELNIQKEEHRPITVDQILAAAEGRTEETKDMRSRVAAQHNAARIGLYAGLIIFLLSTAALLVPNVEILSSFDFNAIVKQPLILLGLVDLACSVLLGLEVVNAYPFIRFRAAFGLGFLSVIFWSQSHPHVVLAVAVGSVGMYFCTVSVSYVPVITAAMLGLAGIGGFAFFMLS